MIEKFAIERCILRIGKSYIGNYLRHLSFRSDIDYPGKNVDDIQESNTEENTECSPKTKLVTVSIVGNPNVGKSTLVNALVKRAVCPASSKVHTTQHNSRAVYNTDDTQLIFTDTPGIITNRDLKIYKFTESCIKDPGKSVEDVDIIALLQDVSNVYKRNRIEHNVLDILKAAENKIPLLLVLNKVDLLKTKQVLLTITKELTTNEEYPKFAEVFMISALNRDGVNDLRQYFLDSAKPGDWKYPPEKCSDQPLEVLIEETVRAHFMDRLVNEIPYRLNIRSQYSGVRPDGSVHAVVDIICPTERISNLLKRGKKLRDVSVAVEADLRHAFQAHVFLRLNVVAKNKLKK